jgi:adenosylmethionine-8-amino-7-oxononanoate aminotransferase
MLPLSAIVTNKSVYDACIEDEFLYGNTAVASPIACANALYALSSYETYAKQKRQENSIKGVLKYSSQPYLLFDEERVKQISCLSAVKQSFTLGSVLAVTLHTSSADQSDMAYRIAQTLWEKDNVLIGINQVNHIGDVVYIMVPPFTKKEHCNRIADILYNTIKTF